MRARSPLRSGKRPAAASGPRYSSSGQLLLYQGIGVVSPSGIIRNVGAQKPEGEKRFHLFSIYKERRADLSLPPGVHDEFVCFKDVQLVIF